MRTWTKEAVPKGIERNQSDPIAAVWSRHSDTSDSSDVSDIHGVQQPLVRDRALVVWSGLATLLGLVFIYDAGYARSLQQGRGPIPREFWMQGIFLVAALGAGLLAARISLEAWRRGARGLWFFTLLALVGLEFVGHEMNGAVRWYKLGPITLQPAEFAKVTAILYLAAALANRKRWPAKVKPARNWGHWLDTVGIPKLKRAMPLLWVFAGFVMIELEPDLGTGALIMATAFAMLWAGGVSRRSLAWCVGLAAVGVLFVVQLQPYRLERITTHFDRWSPANVDGIAYQTVQSELAMASGSLFGVGMGTGRAKHVMPAATTDFISATAAEEFGLLGWLVVAGALFAVTWRLLTLANRAPTPFGRLVLFGIGAWIGGQTLLNLTMANGTLPAIGIPLPFVSSGGSSLVALWVAIGIAQTALAPARVNKEANVAADRDGWRDGRPRLSRA